MGWGPGNSHSKLKLDVAGMGKNTAIEIVNEKFDELQKAADAWTKVLFDQKIAASQEMIN